MVRLNEALHLMRMFHVPSIVHVGDVHVCAGMRYNVCEWKETYRYRSFIFGIILVNENNHFAVNEFIRWMYWLTPMLCHVRVTTRVGVCVCDASHYIAVWWKFANGKYGNPPSELTGHWKMGIRKEKRQSAITIGVPNAVKYAYLMKWQWGL